MYWNAVCAFRPLLRLFSPWLEISLLIDDFVICRLAYVELYITIGTIFRRPEFAKLQVYGMTDKDLEIEDLFAAFPPKGCGILHVVEGV
jgi:hypothetical protein